MNWDLKSDRPIYIQLVEHLQLAIISGLLPPGDVYKRQIWKSRGAERAEESALPPCSLPCVFVGEDSFFLRRPGPALPASAHPDAAPPFCQAGQHTPAQKRAAA